MFEWIALTLIGLFALHYVFTRLRQQGEAKRKWDGRIESIRDLHNDN